jgi:hypothetical protein
LVGNRRGDLASKWTQRALIQINRALARQANPPRRLPPSTVLDVAQTVETRCLAKRVFDATARTRPFAVAFPNAESGSRPDCFPHAMLVSPDGFPRLSWDDDGPDGRGGHYG